MTKKRENPLVYSTASGKVKPSGPAAAKTVAGRQTVYLWREVKGRGGKTVTTISGLAASSEKIVGLVAELKKILGSGGTVKDGIIIIQGDHRDRLNELLAAKGYLVKNAGG